MSFVDSLYKFKRDSDEVKVGHKYRYVNPHRVVETAKVINVKKDTFGIPHVHFSISVDGDTSKRLTSRLEINITRPHLLSQLFIASFIK